jgi:hypothetical protein
MTLWRLMTRGTSILDHFQLDHLASTTDAYGMYVSVQRLRIRYRYASLSWEYELSIVQTCPLPPSISLRERTTTRYQDPGPIHAYPRRPSQISPFISSGRSHRNRVPSSISTPCVKFAIQPPPSNLLRRQQSPRREPYSFVRPNRSNRERRSSLPLPLSILIQLSHLPRPQPPDTRRAQQIHTTDEDLCCKVPRRRNQLESNSLSERDRQHERKADHAESKWQPLHADYVGCDGYHGSPQGTGHCAACESEDSEHSIRLGRHPDRETKDSAERCSEDRDIDATDTV